jgi:hypothetical protein
MLTNATVEAKGENLLRLDRELHWLLLQHLFAETVDGERQRTPARGHVARDRAVFSPNFAEIAKSILLHGDARLRGGQQHGAASAFARGPTMPRLFVNRDCGHHIP